MKTLNMPKLPNEIHRTEILDAQTMNVPTLRKMVQDEDIHIFSVDDGRTVRAYKTYRNIRFEESFLHVTIVWPSGKQLQLRENSKGELVRV